MAWIETAGGISIPDPAFDSGRITISTMVDGSRNANGDFIGQVVGDDKYKVECNFKALTPEQMRNLLKIFDRTQGGAFIQQFKVYDPRIDDYRWMNMYVGDRTGRPFKVVNGRPTYWLDTQANLIEV